MDGALSKYNGISAMRLYGILPTKAMSLALCLYIPFSPTLLHHFLINLHNLKLSPLSAQTTASTQIPHNQQRCIPPLYSLPSASPWLQPPALLQPGVHYSPAFVALSMRPMLREWPMSLQVSSRTISIPLTASITTMRGTTPRLTMPTTQLRTTMLLRQRAIRRRMPDLTQAPTLTPTRFRHTTTQATIATTPPTTTPPTLTQLIIRYFILRCSIQQLIHRITTRDTIALTHLTTMAPPPLGRAMTRSR